VKNRNIEVCSECAEFPYAKFKKPEFYAAVKESSSYPSYKKVLPNLYSVKEHGIGKFLERQNERMRLLERMLREFDDGRSKSFYCRVANHHDIAGLTRSMKVADKAVKAAKIKVGDLKSKSKILKAAIEENAAGG